MNVTQSFKLAIKSLRTSKMRAFLTMLGIIIGVAAVILHLLRSQGAAQKIPQHIMLVCDYFRL